MILTYKYRIKDRRAKRVLAAHAIAVNQVWNYACAYQRDVEARYRLGGPKRKWPSGYDFCKLTSGTSRDLGISSETIDQVCIRFARARNAKRRSPRFRASRGSKRALGWIPVKKNGARVVGNTITYYGNTFRWFAAKRRPLPETVGAMAFAEDALGRWWVCFSVEVQTQQPSERPSVGIDLGLKSFATMSDGSKIEAPQIYRRHEQRLGIAQRAGNKQRVSRLHAKIANCRRDFLHKASTDLVRHHGLIAVGNVSSSKLARTKMAKSVLDAGWSTFRSQLRYKASRHGAVYLQVDENLTTQTCSECGSIAGPRGYAGLNKREWDCPDCGAHHDRDVNSARMILSRALSAQRPAEGSHGPDKRAEDSTGETTP